MKADVLRQGHGTPVLNPTDTSGEWVNQQDPDSGEIIRVWQPNTQDDPDTVENEAADLESFDCIARGIMEGGIRVAGTTERFSELYEAVDYVLITYGKNVKLSRRDRITNIRQKNGEVIWVEEETDTPTVFAVTGVTPIVDPFGKHIENRAMLERVEAQ